MKLDDNRQAISGHLRQADRHGQDGRRRAGRADVPADPGRRPDVRRRFFSADTPPPDRRTRSARRAPPPPWVGNAEKVYFGEVTMAAPATSAERRRADPPLAGGRPALRRRRRRLRRGPRGRARGAARDPRPERRRQDHAVQPHLGRVPADGGHRRAVRAGRHRAARPQARADGALAHVPDLAPVRRPDASRTTSTWPCSASTTGHLRLVEQQRGRRDARERAARWPRRSA